MWLAALWWSKGQRHKNSLAGLIFCRNEKRPELLNLQLSSRQESRPLGTQRLNGCYNLRLVLLQSVGSFTNVFNVCAPAGCGKQPVFQDCEYGPLNTGSFFWFSQDSTEIHCHLSMAVGYKYQQVPPLICNCQSQSCLSLDPFSLKKMSSTPRNSLGLDPHYCLRVSMRCSPNCRRLYYWMK